MCSKNKFFCDHDVTKLPNSAIPEGTKRTSRCACIRLSTLLRTRRGLTQAVFVLGGNGIFPESRPSCVFLTFAILGDLAQKQRALKCPVLPGVMLKDNKQVILLGHCTDRDCFADSKNMIRGPVPTYTKAGVRPECPLPIISPDPNCHHRLGKYTYVPIGNCKDLQFCPQHQLSSGFILLWFSFFFLNQRDHIKNEGYCSSIWNPPA